MAEELPTRQNAEDRLEPLAQAGDTLHDYLVGLAALVARGAGDWVDVLHALDELTTAQRSARRAHEHLINAMADHSVRLGDPLGDGAVATGS